MILSYRVQIEVKIGELQADMPDMLGIGIIYEAVGTFGIFSYLSTKLYYYLSLHNVIVSILNM